MTSAFRNSKTSGFTLLEVVIALAILVFISMAIYQATASTFRLREELGNEGDFYSGVRLATMVLQRDLSLLYSPTIMQMTNPQATPTPGPNGAPLGGGGAVASSPQNQLSDDQTQGSLYWSPAVDSSGLRPSHFVGSETKLSFITVSHIRIYKDYPETSFAKVSYALAPDDSNRETNPELQGTFMLQKTENPNAFSLDDTRIPPTVHPMTLLRGIQKFSYTYYQKDGDTWKKFKTWDSDQQDAKTRYPDMIELQIEVVGKQNLSFEGVFKFKPEIPLNGNGLPSTF